MSPATLARSIPQRTMIRRSRVAARIGRLAGFVRLRRLFAGLAARHRMHRGMADLLALDDRTLKDIGLGRCEIPYHVARAEQAARRRAPARA